MKYSDWYIENKSFLNHLYWSIYHTSRHLENNDIPEKEFYIWLYYQIKP